MNDLRSIPDAQMDISALSHQPPADILRALEHSDELATESAHRLRAALQELEMRRVELEMHNRALRETQAELELAVQRYCDLYDHLPVGYVTVTPEGEIRHANLAVAESLQCERSRLVGCQLRSFLDAYDAGRLAAHLENCAQTGRRSTIELTLRLKDGTSRVVQCASRLAAGTDGRHQIHLAVTDISQLKRAQRMLEDINEEQEAFNYSISHDLRAPLVTIGNYAGILMSDHAAGLSEQGQHMVRRIQGAAARMEATLKNLLQYSMLAREEIALEPVDVERVIDDLLVEHRDVIQERNADITVDRPLPQVRGSIVILTQVCANLLTNALKYTAPDAPPRVQIRAEDSGQTIVLKVIDYGIGIDPKYHERIFQIFERLHGYSHYPGSGVGLAIARRAVGRMNGRIWVESALGKGSCFCVELPKA